MALLKKQCRWEEEAEKALNGIELLFYRGESDYQGSANAMVLRADGRVAYLNWSWGSCSGCDGYEANGCYHTEEDHQTAKEGDYAFGCTQKTSYQLALEDFSRSVQVMDADTAIAFINSLVHAFQLDKYYWKEYQDAKAVGREFHISNYHDMMTPDFAEPVLAQLKEIVTAQGPDNKWNAVQDTLYSAMKEE